MSHSETNQKTRPAVQITRVFRVDVRPDLAGEFEEKFAAISVDVTQSAPGKLVCENPKANEMVSK